MQILQPVAYITPKRDRCITYPQATGVSTGEMELILLYGQQFPRYRPIFKIAIFGHETWPLAKVPEVAHLVSFYPRGVDISAYFCFTGSGFQDMGQFWAEPIAGVVMLLQWPFRGRPGLSAVYLQASGEIADD